MRVWGYKWKPQTLYGAFRRAELEETLMKNGADKVFEYMPQLNYVVIQDAKNVSDEHGNVSLDASLGSEFTMKVLLIEEDNESGALLLQKPAGKKEGNVVDGGIVPSLFDLLVFLGPWGDLIVNGSDNDSPKAWYDDLTWAIKIVSRKCVIEDGAYNVFGEMTQAIRAALIVEDVINHSAKYNDFEKLHLFDPGGNRQSVMSFSREVACLLFGKAQEMFVFAFKGIIPSHRHVISFIYMWKIQCLTNSCLKAALNLSDLSTQFSVKQIIGFVDLVTWEASMVDFKDTEMEMMLGEMVVFDPGGDRLCALSCVNDMKGSTFTLSQIHSTFGKKRLLILFKHFHTIYNGAISSRYFMGCYHFKHSDINQHFPGIKVVSVLEFFAIVWDPGRCAIFIHILEDKDDFKGVGKKMVAMMIMRRSKDDQTDGKCGLNKACKPLWELFILVAFSSHRLPFCWYLLVLRGVLVMVSCVQWYDCPLCVRSCSPHNIQIFEKISESVEMIILNSVELTSQNKLGWSVWWKAIILDITLFIFLCEAFCQIKIWNSLSKLHMSMAKKDNMLQVLIVWSTCSSSKHVKSYKVSLSNKGVMFSFLYYMVCCSLKTNCDRQYLGFWFGGLVPNGCPTSVLVMALSPLSCASHSLWQCHSKREKSRDIMDKLIVMVTWSLAQEETKGIVDNGIYISGIQHFLKHCSTWTQPYKTVKYVALLILSKHLKDSSNNAMFSFAVDVTLSFWIPVLVFQPP